MLKLVQIKIDTNQKRSQLDRLVKLKYLKLGFVERTAHTKEITITNFMIMDKT